MGIFFGTDGLRGTFDELLSAEVAFKTGNALARLLQKSKIKKLDENNDNSGNILIGTDTRQTASVLSTAFASGAMSSGVNVTFISECPTAGIGYLMKKHGFDYGVVISASHNPAEFNGIKIFDKNLNKLCENDENFVEQNMLKIKSISFDRVGRLTICEDLKKDYIDFLIEETLKEFKLKNKNFDQKVQPFKDLKIVLDTSNGASYKIAPFVFERLGAEVITLSNNPNGKNINQNCGSLHPQNLKQSVIDLKADIGFAFDGDSDRVIAILSNGELFDGDDIVFAFAKHYKLCGKNIEGVAVTEQTNIKIQMALEELNIIVERTKVGDKYVSAKLDSYNWLVGGEQAGHVFLKDKLKTGDGILNALILTAIYKIYGNDFQKMFCVSKYVQKNYNVVCKNKTLVLSNLKVIQEIEQTKAKLNGFGRVLVRASGTEPIVRIMVECEDKNLSEIEAKRLKSIVEIVDKEV